MVLTWEEPEGKMPRVLFLVVDGDRFKVFRLEYLTAGKAVYVVDPFDSIEGLGFGVITTRGHNEFLPHCKELPKVVKPLIGGYFAALGRGYGYNSSG